MGLSGKGTGVSPFGDHYPFILPSAEVRHVLSEAHISVLVPGFTPPLRIVWMHGFDTQLPPRAGIAHVEDGSSTVPISGSALPVYTPTHAADVVIRDAADQVVFNSTAVTDYRGAAIGSRLYAHDWIDQGATVRLVQHTRFPDDGYAHSVASTVTPIDGRLDPRTSTQHPTGLGGFFVDDIGFNLVNTFIPGYNVDIAVGEETIEDLRRTRVATLSAKPGGGVGRAPGCAEASDVVTRFGGASADSTGAFALDADDCYYVRPDVTIALGVATPEPGRILIGNDCGPPCSPEDYHALQTSLLALWARLQAAATKAIEARDRLAEGARRWAEVADINSTDALRVAAFAHNYRYLEVSVAVCHRSDTCLTNALIEFVVTELVGGGTVRDITVDPYATFISLADGTESPYALAVVAPAPGTHGRYFATWSKIPPKSGGRIRFRLNFDFPVPATPTFVCTVDVTAHGLDGSPTMSVSQVMGGP